MDDIKNGPPGAGGTGEGTGIQDPGNYNAELWGYLPALEGQLPPDYCLHEIPDAEEHSLAEQKEDPCAAIEAAEIPQSTVAPPKARRTGRFDREMAELESRAARTPVKQQEFIESLDEPPVDPETEKMIEEIVERAGAPEAAPAPFTMAQFSMAGQSAEMRLKMQKDTYVLGLIALLGQWTAIYAKPNTGKTLLAMHLLIESIKAGQINGEDVFYINADDTFKGLVTKVELAEKHGFHMLAPGHNGFDADRLLRYLQSMIESDRARGQVLILDTLKKFTDIMDKRVSSGFGKAVRSFVSHGGTVIVLAHTNKNRDAEGKVVFSGTSDIVDDADCAYTLDSTEAGGDSKTVLFENLKQRGDVARQVAYTYSTKEKQTYADLLASVCELSEDKMREHRERSRIKMMLDRNADAIEAITEAIQSGVDTKTELIGAASKASGIPRRTISKALDAHTGDDWKLGHRWRLVRLEHNAKKYHLLTVWMPKADYQTASRGE